MAVGTPPVWRRRQEDRYGAKKDKKCTKCPPPCFSKLGACRPSTTLKQSVIEPLRLPIMPEVAPLPSVRPPPPSFNATATTSGLLTTTTLLPWEEVHMQVHTILIVVIFCVVCLLLLLAFFYAFCFHCSIGSLPKDSHAANGCSLDREDATYKRSSSDNLSVGNVV